MPSPFPGMDPYLETMGLWPDFHAAFVTYWADDLFSLLPESYEPRIAERHVVTSVSPTTDEETTERHIEILHRPDRTLVAVLELLSPANKEEPGRSQYLAKRNAVVRHPVHLVELDLLLKGQRLPLAQELPPGDYYALVSRADQRPDCQVYAWTLQQSLPAIPIPLLAADPDVWCDIGAVFATTWQRGRYAGSVDYTSPPLIALDDARLAWVREQTGGVVRSES
ncbi:MAG: DUF4058 family protein [Planctomycetia bacterium]|nr:DUF4058 family protein [Planctomycetia bacterium]